MAQLLRAGLDQLRFRAEAPRHAEAGKSGVARRLQIDLGISDVDRVFPTDAEALHALVDHVRRGLAGNARHFADGHGNELVEIQLAQQGNDAACLVGNDGHGIAFLLKTLQNFRNSDIWLRFVVIILGIIPLHFGKDGVDRRFIRLCRHGAADEHP